MIKEQEMSSVLFRWRAWNSSEDPRMEDEVVFQVMGNRMNKVTEILILALVTIWLSCF